MGAISRLLRVRPGEGRTVALVVALTFVATTAHTIGESGVGALLFDRVGTDALPVLYLAQGGVGLVGMLVLAGAFGRFDRRRGYVALPLLTAAIVLVERAVATADPAWIYPALWLTVTIAMLMQAVFLWGTAGLVTDTRRAKRLFPLFGAGGILGAVAGGFVTPPLARAIGAQNLLIVWGIGLLAAAALCASVLGVRRRTGHRGRVRARRVSPLTELARGSEFVRRSSLLRWMTGASVLFSVLYWSLYLPYAQAATARFPDPDDLAGFFGVFWASVTAVAFFASILLTNRLLGWFGAAVMIVALPLLYGGAFGTLLAASTFGAIVAVRFGVNVWLQGVASPAWETLTNVVPEGRRDQTRAFLNGGPTQVGTAIAGVVQLVGQQVLSGTQLTLVGLAAAVVTLLVAWKIRRSYTSALVDALSAGRPTVFGDVPVGAPIVLQQDAQARALAIAALRDPDARMRRVAVAMLDPEGDERAAGALIRALEDEDALVRSNALRAIARAGAPASLFEPAMRDPDPNVRVAAVLGLRANGASSATPTDLLDDPDPSVAAAAAVNLLGGPRRHDAAGALSRLLGAEEPSLRVEALRQVRSAAPEDAEELASSLAAEAPGVVRAAALETLASSGAKTVITAALDALDSDDHAVRRAALDALHHVDVRGSEDAIRGYARSRGAWAEADRARAASVPIAPGGGLARESSELLRDALRSRGRSHAVAALSALAVLSDDREAMRTALESLGTSDPGQLANALETLEVAGGAARVRPLLILWEAPQQPRPPDGDAEGLEPLLHDDDPLIRACAELVRAAGDGGDQMTRSRTSMSTVERILILRRIPLFAELSPAELERVAAIAEEHAYADGEVIAAEGELGEELHIVVEGTVRVVRGEGNRTIARRGSGDVVGEMSIITRAPRVATLIAEGDVRTVRIGSREFEGMIRERPEVALAVMRVLAGRITTEAAQ